MRLMNIVGIFPGQVDTMVAEAKRLYREAGIDETLLSMSLHRQGGERLEKAMMYKQLLREFKAQLEGTGIKVGVLLQSLIGHRNDAVVEDADWQRAENINGTPLIRGCILSQTLRDYVYDVVKLIAEEGPDSLMIDDDCCLLKWRGAECFCDEHMRRFNAVSTRQFTAEALKTHFKEQGPQDEAVMLFEKLRMDALEDFARLVREAIDSVDPDIPCSCCTPGAEFMSIDRVAKAVAGKNRPLIRLCNANYLEGDAKDFPRVTYKAFALRNLIEGDIDVIDEADTYPHNRYSKAAVALHAKLTVGALNGEVGAKIWLSNIYFQDSYTQRKYDEILGRYRNYYPAIVEIIRTAKATGPITPLPTKASVFKQFHPLAVDAAFYAFDWQRDFIAHYGVPARYARLGEPGIYLVTSDMLRFFDDAEIAEMLSQHVLLDDKAARILIDRGFGDEIGVTFGTEAESVTDGRLCASGSYLPYGFAWDVFPMIPADGAEVVAELIRAPYAKAPEEQLAYVGAAACWWKNAGGGRIGIVREPKGGSFRHPAHRELLIEMLECLNDGPLAVIVECDQNVYARTWVLPDGSTLLAVFNLNFDPMASIDVSTTEPLKSVKLLDENGTWQPVQWDADGVVSRIAHRLETYGVALLRVLTMTAEG